MVIGDDAVRRRQAQPGSGPGLLGGEERIENALLRFAIHPDARVGNGDLDVGPGGEVVGRRFRFGQFHGFRNDRQGTPLGHRLPGVHKKVEQNLFDLTFVGLDGSDGLFQIGVDRDLFLGAAKGGEGACDEMIEVDGADFILTLAGEAQQAMRQFHSSLQVALDFPELTGERVLLRKVVEHQTHTTLDAHQQVVEVMGDTAGQGADGFQALGPLQACLGALLFSLHGFDFGDVGGHLPQDIAPVDPFDGAIVVDEPPAAGGILRFVDVGAAGPAVAVQQFIDAAVAAGR